MWKIHIYKIFFGKVHGLVQLNTIGWSGTQKHLSAPWLVRCILPNAAINFQIKLYLNWIPQKLLLIEHLPRIVSSIEIPKIFTDDHGAAKTTVNYKILGCMSVRLEQLTHKLILHENLLFTLLTNTLIWNTVSHLNVCAVLPHFPGTSFSTKQWRPVRRSRCGTVQP